jgi:hypothetical protein
MNMGPDRNSYETWIIDYLDGTLDKESTALLFAFLEENPDIKEEFADLAPLSLKPGRRQFPEKDKLKKTPSDMTRGQFEMLCVASAENDLEDEQKADLEAIIASDPDKNKTFELFQKIRLTSPSETYRYKYKLRKLTSGQRLLRYSLTFASTAAAVLAVFIILKRPEPFQNPSETVSLSSVTPSASAISKPQNNTTESTSTTLSDKGERRVTAMNSVPDAQKINTYLEKQPSNDSLQKAPSETVIEKYNIEKITVSEDGLKRSGSEVRLASINITPVNTEADEAEKGPGQIVEKLLKEKTAKPNETGKGSLNAYAIADAGVNGLKKLFGWDISLRKNKDEKGEVKSVSFSSKLVSFNAPVRKSTHRP